MEARTSFEESVAAAAKGGDPTAKALIAAWSRIKTLEDLLSGKCLTASVEDAADRAGIGLNTFRDGVRAGVYPHFHLGEKEGVARVDLRALDDFLYELAMNHMTEHRGDAPVSMATKGRSAA